MKQNNTCVPFIFGWKCAFRAHPNAMEFNTNQQQKLVNFIFNTNACAERFAYFLLSHVHFFLQLLWCQHKMFFKKLLWNLKICLISNFRCINVKFSMREKIRQIYHLNSSVECGNLSIAQFVTASDLKRYQILYMPNGTEWVRFCSFIVLWTSNLNNFIETLFSPNFLSLFISRYKIQPAKKDTENGTTEFNPFTDRQTQHPTS